MNTGGPAAIDEANYLMQGYIEYLQKGQMVGASGAISGVLAAFAVFDPWRKLQPTVSSHRHSCNLHRQSYFLG